MIVCHYYLNRKFIFVCIFEPYFLKKNVFWNKIKLTELLIAFSIRRFIQYFPTLRATIALET